MAAKTTNDSVGLDRVVQTLLGFGALPRLGLPNDGPTSSNSQQTTPLRNETAAMSKHFTSRQFVMHSEPQMDQT